jgi:hypothetical protein
MESIIDMEREEARSMAREFGRERVCPDIEGRDVVGGYEPPRPVFDTPYDPANDPF